MDPLFHSGSNLELEAPSDDDRLHVALSFVCGFGSSAGCYQVIFCEKKLVLPSLAVRRDTASGIAKSRALLVRLIEAGWVNWILLPFLFGVVSDALVVWDKGDQSQGPLGSDQPILWDRRSRPVGQSISEPSD